MKCFMLIMALAIDIVSPDGTCVSTNSYISTNSQCFSSTVTNSYINNSQLDATTCTNSQYNGAHVMISTTTNCNINNSQLFRTTCTNSQYSGVYITSSTTTNTHISGPGCSISTCTINGGIASPSACCRITGCILSAIM
ncbi:hypothetical protein MSG28_000194 [Choristoneura fumiferana]|uniref:Uncharacterized protein n=1 Tax=Choristoneura fumiferana TaxID=7141 RepID=A0ACC0JZW9_CHOFU|nr:hypothetical protein MSG28_000194 [Choristoneura fumiferana]